MKNDDLKAIVNAHIVLPDSIILDGVMLVKDGRIVCIGEPGEVSVPGGAEVIDARGHYAGPGFVDIHTHAGGGVWFYDDPQSASSHHLDHGTTSILPALYYNLTLEQYMDAIRRIKAASTKGDARIIAGLYMEGPYLNPKYGCEASSNRWADGVDPARYRSLIEEAGRFARVWCIAPELPGIEQFVDDVRGANDMAVLSVAHSEASPAQIFRYVEQGLKLATHHTNATGDLPKYPECRGVCVDEAVNFCDDIYAELICDSRGIHVDPLMLRLVVKIKGRDKVILVSDCFVADGPVPPGYEGVTDINFDHAGEIAGCKLTLDAACRNMMRHTGAGICDVFRYAAYNPARLLGLRDVGRIATGARANIVIVDHLMNVRQVLFEGQQVR
jgi:N-acetylglucosamine-6-phosphate deacetylase